VKEFFYADGAGLSNTQLTGGLYEVRKLDFSVLCFKNEHRMISRIFAAHSGVRFLKGKLMYTGHPKKTKILEIKKMLVIIKNSGVFLCMKFKCLEMNMFEVMIVCLFYQQSLMESLNLRSMSTPQLIEMFYKDMCERQVMVLCLSVCMSVCLYVCMSCLCLCNKLTFFGSAVLCDLAICLCTCLYFDY